MPFVSQRPKSAYNEEREPLAKGEPVESGESFGKKWPLVFLDTNIMVGY